MRLSIKIIPIEEHLHRSVGRSKQQGGYWIEEALLRSCEMLLYILCRRYFVHPASTHHVMTNHDPEAEQGQPSRTLVTLMKASTTNKVRKS